MDILLYILAGLVVLVLILALLAPKSYDVSRTVEIQRPRTEVFEFLRFLGNQEKWSPWERKDPNMHKEFRGVDGQVGALSAWKGNKDVGEGEQEITRIVPGERIESQLRFFKPWKSTSDAYLDVSDAGPGKTKVRWGFAGKNRFPMSIMMLFMNMDKMVGKDFEAGLSDLKAYLEAGKDRKR